MMTISLKPLRVGLLASVFSSFLLAQLAQAVPLPPGSSAFIVGEPDPIGGVVVATLTLPFVGGSAPGGFSGSITTTVISGDAANLLGGLTFTYQFSNLAGSAEAIKRLTVEGYAGFLTDVSYQVPAGGIPPMTVDRSVSGSVIGFDWFLPALGSGWVHPGGTSALLVIQTDAKTWSPAQANLIDGAVAEVGILAPGVPDGGATVLLLGCVLVGIEGLRRKLAIVR